MDKPCLAVFNTQPPHLYYGGVERRILETAKRLQNNLDIAIYSGSKAGFKTPQTVNGAKLYPVKSTDKLFPLDNCTFNRNLTHNAAAIKADIFEAHAASAYGFQKKLYQLNRHEPFIHTVHGVLADEYDQAKANGYASVRDRVANWFMRYLAGLEKEMAQQASLVVTISNYSVEKLKTYYNIDARKVRIVPNGVDTEIFKPMAETAELKLNFGLDDGPMVLFVGSLTPRKGVMYLVDVAKTVVSQFPNAKFVLVGKGPLKGAITEAVGKKGLGRNFVFLGNLSEAQLAQVYCCADIFVLPSIQEGQGIVLLEAQACGVPVVAFNSGGVGEAMVNGKTGLLVERGDSKTLAEALLGLLSDVSLRAKMGGAGRMFVECNFSWDVCAGKQLKVYEDVLNFKQK